MNKSVLVALAALAVGQGQLALGQPLELGIPEIRKYHSDYNYVVACSTISERWELVRQACDMQSGGNTSEDSRLRTTGI
jgi:hypothetical protein